jgi:hypothetical protein
VSSSRLNITSTLPSRYSLHKTAVADQLLMHCLEGVTSLGVEDVAQSPSKCWNLRVSAIIL